MDFREEKGRGEKRTVCIARTIRRAALERHAIVRRGAALESTRVGAFRHAAEVMVVPNDRGVSRCDWCCGRDYGDRDGGCVDGETEPCAADLGGIAFAGEVAVCLWCCLGTG